MNAMKRERESGYLANLAFMIFHNWDHERALKVAEIAKKTKGVKRDTEEREGI